MRLKVARVSELFLAFKEWTDHRHLIDGFFAEFSAAVPCATCRERLFSVLHIDFNLWRANVVIMRVAALISIVRLEIIISRAWILV